ncbi:MAG: response regulator [Sphingobacteriaceae bacterium]
MINILLAEDHNIVRNGISSLLDSDPELKVVGEAANGVETLRKIYDEPIPDIILADINMPELDGLELLRALKNINSPIKVIILSSFDYENYIIEAMNAGAWGYLLKNVSKEEMIFAIKKVSNDQKYLCSEVSFKFFLKAAAGLHHTIDTKAVDSLSKREIEVLNLIAEGHSNIEIADLLFTSRRTVEGHRQKLLKKSGCNNTATLIRFAIRSGIIK